MIACTTQIRPHEQSDDETIKSSLETYHKVRKFLPWILCDRERTDNRNMVQHVLTGQRHLPDRPRVDSQAGPYCDKDTEDTCAPYELVHLWSLRQGYEMSGEPVGAC